MTRDERAASFAGFDAHVAKPLSAQTLIETICTVEIRREAYHQQSFF